uniref:Uncharacterized protein n=1 Tax=Rhizophagus irregularis (strain DAOM 181602 / DAOM 197198 / MUCL 43194) TaxID=747089 RepID=U9T0C4_RHIID
MTSMFHSDLFKDIFPILNGCNDMVSIFHSGLSKDFSFDTKNSLTNEWVNLTWKSIKREEILELLASD